ncbi:MAG: dTMP kinase [Methanomicrobia archaeon]|nr:dTMP kinase [Methanomicrobia archaeon]
MMTRKKGWLIVFEGLDGSGLSTQAALLAEHLRENNEKVMLTKEPTTSPIGELIRSALKRDRKFLLYALQLLFAADRAEHLEKEIEPALQANEIVISDRYILSSLAFGSVDNDVEFLKQINARFRSPDLTIIIDTPPRVCRDRIVKNRDNIELFEEEKRLEKVRERYLALKDYFDNTVILAGDRAKEAIAKDIQGIVARILTDS